MYNSKIAAANLFKILASQLTSVADVVIGFYHESVIKALEFSAKDRVLKVQQASHAAIKEWKKLKEIHEDLESKKMLEEAKGLSEEDLIKMRLSAPKTVIANNVKKPDDNIWGMAAKARFLKKRMGTGGGYLALEREKGAGSPLKKIPQNIQREGIKSVINKFLEAGVSNKFPSPLPEIPIKQPLADRYANPYTQENQIIEKESPENVIPEVMPLPNPVSGIYKGITPQEFIESKKAEHIQNLRTQPEIPKIAETVGLEETLKIPRPEEKIQTDTTSEWVKSLQKASQGDFQSAYQNIVNTGIL